MSNQWFINKFHWKKMGHTEQNINDKPNNFSGLKQFCTEGQNHIFNIYNGFIFSQHHSWLSSTLGDLGTLLSLNCTPLYDHFNLLQNNSYSESRCYH